MGMVGGGSHWPGGCEGVEHSAGSGLEPSTEGLGRRSGMGVQRAVLGEGPCWLRGG